MKEIINSKQQTRAQPSQIEVAISFLSLLRNLFSGMKHSQIQFQILRFLLNEKLSKIHKKKNL